MRRMAILEFPAESVVRLLRDQGKHCLRVEMQDALPDDARAVWSTVDPISGVIRVVVESSMFPEYGDACELPTLPRLRLVRHRHVITEVEV